MTFRRGEESPAKVVVRTKIFLRNRNGGEETAVCRMPTEMPGRRGVVPGTSPAKPIAEDKPAAAANAQLLNDRLEPKVLRVGPARIAARHPDVAPNQVRSLGQIDSDLLIVSASLERDRRAG